MAFDGWNGLTVSFARSVELLHDAPHPELLCKRSIGHDVTFKHFRTREMLEAFIRRQNRKPAHYTHWIPVVPL